MFHLTDHLVFHTRLLHSLLLHPINLLISSITQVNRKFLIILIPRLQRPNLHLSLLERLQNLLYVKRLHDIVVLLASF
jgi:hypothetical protein